MRSVALIHFQPLELYPPVMNFIDCCKEEAGVRGLDIFTTYCYADVTPYEAPARNIKIRRYGSKRRRFSPAGRAWHYLRFYFLTTWRLFLTRPDTVIYFETFSAFPAYIYKKFINRRSRLFIHYHEYMTPYEYESGMYLIRHFHRLEKRIYGRADWISHTNIARMDRFVKDLEGVSIPNRNILPNYPPAAWQRDRNNEIRLPVRAVYVGAFSLDTMYIREFADWLLRQKGDLIWDIYSLNMTGEAREFIRSLPEGLVRILPGVSYKDLPGILAGYDVGLILYTGHIPNWVDNAPNKLFEYLNCGLDVWLPVNMKGSLPFLTTDTYPKVIAMDFTLLAQANLYKMIDRKGLTYRPSAYNCETIYSPLWRRIQGR